MDHLRGDDDDLLQKGQMADEILCRILTAIHFVLCSGRGRKIKDICITGKGKNYVPWKKHASAHRGAV